MCATKNQQDREQLLLEWLQSIPRFTVDQFRMVSGDASFRRYFRFEDCGTSYIAVDAPPDKESNHEFYHIAKSYRDAGVRVPDIIEVDLALGFWVLEDFGDSLLSDHYDSDVVESLYAKALDALHNIQAATIANNRGLPTFDDQLLGAEFHLFNHWLLEVHLKLELSDDEQSTLQQAQSLIRNVFKEQPQVGVHRDYHSRNLMVLENDEIGIIDFQDAVIGPITYDAVSLLRDCYVVWPKDMVARLLNSWSAKLGSDFNPVEFERWFDFVGMQRHIKASGIFCRLCYRDGKTLYLNDIPRTLQYIVDIAARYPETSAFGALVANKILPAVHSQEAA